MPTLYIANRALGGLRKLNAIFKRLQIMPANEGIIKLQNTVI